MDVFLRQYRACHPGERAGDLVLAGKDKHWRAGELVHALVPRRLLLDDISQRDDLLWHKDEPRHPLRAQPTRPAHVPFGDRSWRSIQLAGVPSQRRDLHREPESPGNAAPLFLQLEPALKFVSIYVLVIVLERKKATDLVLSICVVQGLFLIVLRPAFDVAAIAALTGCVVLLAV